MDSKYKEEYVPVFSQDRGGWCVFKKLTSSIRDFHCKCSDEEDAIELADQLSSEEDVLCFD